MSKRPSDRRRATEQGEIELNLLPFMNLMTLLIPFLLYSASFITIAVIDSSLPAIGAPNPDKEKEKDEKVPLNLTIGITDEGFLMSGSAASLGCGQGADASENTCKQIPKSEDAAYCAETQCGGVTDSACVPEPTCHDFNALHDVVKELKNPRWEGGKLVTEYPDEGNVIIAPDKDILYSVLVKVMDATRETEAPTGGTVTARVKGQETGSESDCYPRVCLFPYVVLAGGVK
ncbi:MAG: hypothetical protein CL928_07585 [Deltaproteobacteria bacterium]|nr:hypothetical protein [Deltaproteobacteria bacterium]